MSDQERINESGLFFFKSDLTEDRKIEILNFYHWLSKEQKDMVNDLIREGKDEVEFFNQSDFK